MSFAEFFTQHAKYQTPMATRTQYYQPLCQMFLLELPLPSFLYRNFSLAHRETKEAAYETFTSEPKLEFAAGERERWGGGYSGRTSVLYHIAERWGDSQRVILSILYNHTPAQDPHGRKNTFQQRYNPLEVVTNKGIIYNTYADIADIQAKLTYFVCMWFK